MVDHKLFLIIAILSALVISAAVQAQDSSLTNIENQIKQIGALPSGSAFVLQATDTELTEDAKELLAKYQTQVNEALKKTTNMKIEVSDPLIKFGEGYADISIRAGVSFIRGTAKMSIVLTAQDGKPVVTVRSMSIPVVNISADQANGYIKTYATPFINQLTNYCTVQSIEIQEGTIKIMGTRS